MRTPHPLPRRTRLAPSGDAKTSPRGDRKLFHLAPSSVARITTNHNPPVGGYAELARDVSPPTGPTRYGGSPAPNTTRRPSSRQGLVRSLARASG